MWLGLEIPNELRVCIMSGTELWPGSLSNEQLVYGSWGCYVNASCKSFNRSLLFCVDVCTVCDNPIMGLDTATWVCTSLCLPAEYRWAVEGWREIWLGLPGVQGMYSMWRHNAWHACVHSFTFLSARVVCTHTTSLSVHVEWRGYWC